uniref:protein-serine/threonine phosphatase n=1 Tax=Caenorhabditis tropicalis TaxID=1561998 RepID=A0A1I7UR89_9PELO
MFSNLGFVDAIKKSNDVMVDEVIVKILNIGSSKSSIDELVHAKTCMALMDRANQGAMLEIESPVKICGDVHGQYSDVLRMFERGSFPPLANYLFLGDYVDRGPQSLEVVTLFIAYKVKFPANFFMLRENHECGAINRVYGFLDEISRKYGSKTGMTLWNSYQTCFAYMPYTALVSGRILCMHGGISRKMTSLDQLRRLYRPLLEIPNPSLENDIMWSDPEQNINGFENSTRGIGHVFGENALTETMNRLGVQLVARAHQVVQDGYEFFCNKKLVTIFSAPNYCGEFNNAAAMMNVDQNLVCSFTILRPNF